MPTPQDRAQTAQLSITLCLLGGCCHYQLIAIMENVLPNSPCQSIIMIVFKKKQVTHLRWGAKCARKSSLKSELSIQHNKKKNR